MHRITDAELEFVNRFLPAFFQGQPSNGPFSFLHDVKPARVSMDVEDDAIELGDYSIQVCTIPTNRHGLTRQPAKQYEVTVNVTITSHRRDEPDTADLVDVGTADTLRDALLLVLNSAVRTHAQAMLDGLMGNWMDELAASS